LTTRIECSRRTRDKPIREVFATFPEEPGRATIFLALDLNFPRAANADTARVRALGERFQETA
jgi:hypothetical protein